MTGTLICDEDGLYDPRNFNDRLLLGMKGQISEARAPFHPGPAARRALSKARRGELIMPLPVGLVYDAAGHVILDPDTAVQGALRHLFATFEATGSASAVREGVQRRRADLPLAAPQRPPQGRAGLETAAAPHRPARAAQPPLRRRVHLRPAPRPAAARREDASPSSCPARNGSRSSPAPTPDTSPWTSTRPTSPGSPPTPPRTAATAPPGHPAKAPRCCRASSSAAAAAAG